MVVNGLFGPFVFMLLTGVLGLVVCIILLVNNNEKTLGNRLLALSLFSISYVLLFNASVLTHLYQLYPYLFKLFHFITFFIGPLSYLYVRTVLRQEYRLSKTDYLFFLPALLVFMNRIPFLLMNRDEQLAVINNVNANLKLVVLEPEGFLPPGYLSVFRIVLTFTFVFAQLLLVIQWKNKLDKNRIHLRQNNELVHWLQIFSMLLMTSLSLLVIQTFLQVSSKFHFEQIIIFTMGLTNLIASIMLFARPRILYGMVGWMQEIEPMLSVKDSFQKPARNLEEIKRQSLTIDEGRNYMSKLEEHLKKSKGFLEPGYTINDLARELKIPVYQLSSFINQEYQKSYVQFINDQRFEYFLLMKKEDPDFKNYTIDYIGKKIGFNSRTSFVAFIKKRTGKTPSEFLKET